MNSFYFCVSSRISIAKVAEFCRFEWTNNGVHIGASYPINKISDRFKETKSHNERILSSYVQQIRWFASCQIRNVACLGGNIVTASPISDLNPIHLASGEARVREHGGGSLIYLNGRRYSNDRSTPTK